MPRFPPRTARLVKIPRVCKVNGMAEGTLINEQTAIIAVKSDISTLDFILFFEELERTLSLNIFHLANCKIVAQGKSVVNQGENKTITKEGKIWQFYQS